MAYIYVDAQLTDLGLESFQFVTGNSTVPVGIQILQSRGVFPEARWYWIGIGAMIGFVLVFNLLFSITLSLLDRKPFRIILHISSSVGNKTPNPTLAEKGKT